MVQGATVRFDVLTIFVQVPLHALEFFAVLPELGLVGGDLRFAGMISFVCGQFLFVLLNDRLLLLDGLLVLLDVLLVVVDIVLGVLIGPGAALRESHGAESQACCQNQSQFSHVVGFWPRKGAPP